MYIFQRNNAEVKAVHREEARLRIINKGGECNERILKNRLDKV